MRPALNTTQPEITDNRRKRVKAIILSEFWNRMQKPVGCWLFDGAKEINGYGYLLNPFGDRPKFLTAHRVAWILTNGPIPDGMRVLHKCDIRACCNPDHLFLGTDADNAEDMRRKGRSGSQGEKCIHAKLTEEIVREIRKQFVRVNERKSNIREMAKRYGVTPGAIREVVLNLTWTHVK